MSIRIVYIAEIVGRAGVFAVKKILPGLRERERPDLVIANGSGTTGGTGLGKAHSVYLRKLGIDIITTGEAAFYKKDIVEAFPSSPWLLRPANHPQGVPGRGLRIHKLPNANVAVIQLLGQTGFGRIHLDNPFHILDAILKDIGPEPSAVFLEFRAGTTAEKNAMFRYADGRVSAVIGSHSRTLSADAQIGEGGTAYITDAGMTGSVQSVCGMDGPTRIREFMSGIPAWAKDATLLPELQGCVLELGDDRSALSIRPLRIACKEEFHERDGHSN